MMTALNRFSTTLICVLGLGRIAPGQATPTASNGTPAFSAGPNLPTIQGNFQFSLSAAEIAQLGVSGYSGTASTTSFSGNLEYLSRSESKPFSIFYGGGILYSSQLYGGAPTTFQSMTVSQGLVGHGWGLGLSDSASYLPSSPTTGLEGIPGIGDQGIQPTPDPNIPVQSILTYNSSRVSNTAMATVSRQLNGRTSLSGSGNYSVLDFLGGVGIDTTQIGGQAGLSRRLDPRSGGGVSVSYSTYGYSGGPTFIVRGASVSYNRQMSRSLSFDGSVGPQLVSAYHIVLGSGATRTTVFVPSSQNVSGSAGMVYTKRNTTATLRYNRGVNSGSGVQEGALSDSGAAQLQHTYGRNWAASVSGTYTRTTGLAANLGATTSFYGGGQVNRRIGQSFSVFASYTAVDQSISKSLAGVNAINGISQSIAAGITFSPRLVRLNQF